MLIICAKKLTQVDSLNSQDSPVRRKQDCLTPQVRVRKPRKVERLTASQPGSSRARIGY